jgi:hypothetical protein
MKSLHTYFNTVQRFLYINTIVAVYMYDYKFSVQKCYKNTFLAVETKKNSTFVLPFF